MEWALFRHVSKRKNTGVESKKEFCGNFAAALPRTMEGKKMLEYFKKTSLRKGGHNLTTFALQSKFKSDCEFFGSMSGMVKLKSDHGFEKNKNKNYRNISMPYWVQLPNEYFCPRV